MPSEELINEIISKCPAVTREQILKALEEEKRRTAGLIEDPTLLRLVAHKLGAKISSEEMPGKKLSTRILVPQLNDVTISGRIIATFPSRAFEGNKPGKFASLIMADKDGLLRVMLWNDKADFIESELLRPGKIARFTHAYTREDRSGRTELHLGEKSVVETAPQKLSEQDYPSVEETIMKVNQICPDTPLIHLSGRAKNISSLSAFARQDQTSGKVMHFTLFDETGEIQVVAWNEKAEELSRSLTQERIIRLVNVKVKRDSNNGLELHVDSSAFQEVIF